jgi:hypothetical protein
MRLSLRLVIYQQAVAVARMTSLPDVYEELPSLTELLSD